MTNRRTFLKSTLAALSVGALAGCGAASTSNTTDANSTPANAESLSNIEAPSFPFEWKKMDVADVQTRAWNSFYGKGGCAIAVFDGILGLMAETYGYPYNQIPVEMYYNGHAGYSASSLCGSLGGAAGILGLFLPTDSVDEQLKNLEAWYAAATLPYYQPELELPCTVANSVNCADSVGKWMTAAGVDSMGDDRRKARCAGVSADVAGKVVEMLNVFYGFAEASVEEDNSSELADNQYMGTAKGNQGDVTVRVTVEDGKVSKVEVVEQNETVGIGDKAINELTDKFVGMSTEAEVDALDAVSGATDTSNALKGAVKAALAQIG